MCILALKGNHENYKTFKLKTELMSVLFLLAQHMLLSQRYRFNMKLDKINSLKLM